MMELHISTLMQMYFQPHWEILTPAPSEIQIMLCPFSVALGLDISHVTYGYCVGQRVSFDVAQKAVGRHMMSIMRQDENKPVLDQINEIAQGFRYRPNDEPTRTALAKAIADYWDKNIPYDIQTITPEIAETLLMGSQPLLCITKPEELEGLFTW